MYTKISVALALAMLVANGCDGGREGERCNPLLSHDDCNGGLVCTQPATCAESYCCPANGSSTNPFCNGSACPPAPDAGSASPTPADAGSD